MLRRLHIVCSTVFLSKSIHILRRSGLLDIRDIWLVNKLVARADIGISRPKVSVQEEQELEAILGRTLAILSDMF